MTPLRIIAVVWFGGALLTWLALVLMIGAMVVRAM
jgi:hypothetical protein